MSLARCATRCAPFTPASSQSRPAGRSTFTAVCSTQAPISAAAGPQVHRRELLQVATLVSTACLVPDANAARGGFVPVKDGPDGYSFLYPFGWQEVSIDGQDVVFKDVIEPLESVSVGMVPTPKKDVAEYGDAKEVAYTLADKVLTAPTQEVKLIDARERTTNGRKYIDFEFQAKSSNYTRHALASVTVGNGKFYTLLTGANERRWGKMQQKLSQIVNSFEVVERAGKTRLAKYWVPVNDDDKKKQEDEIYRSIANRDSKFTNFLEYKTYKLVYRRYAGLYFVFCVDVTDNELLYLESIHLFVELLDHYFGNVCELDLVFGFHKVYCILDEFVIGGEIQETSKKVVLDRIKELDAIET